MDINTLKLFKNIGVYGKSKIDKEIYKGIKTYNEDLDNMIYDFYVRILNDGVNVNFLIKQVYDYYPTFRAKLYYALMYPVGIIRITVMWWHCHPSATERNIH